MEIKINRDGEEYGPYTVEQVNELLANGTLLPTDLAWHDPMETWAELSLVAASLNDAGDAGGDESSAGEYRGGGRYRIIKQLGRGGMGVVYLALDEQLNEEVALKSFPPEMAVDESALDDMKREVQKSRKLSHPNIIRMHDFVNPPGEDPFVTMEYVQGQELADMRHDQPNDVFQWENLQDYILQLCDALTTAHNENTVHRDLKPTQMMINTEGRLKLCDFGIAASMADSLSFSSMKHAVSGTLLFMSPQQMNGEVPRATDDIYALGATLYDLLTGKPPFYTGNVNQQVMNRVPVSMNSRLKEFGLEGKVPDYVDQLVLACLAKESAHRLASAEEIKNWILTEGGAATLKMVRIPLWGDKAVEVDRKKLKISGAVAGVLVAGFLGYTWLKPEPIFNKADIRQEISEGLMLHMPLDTSTAIAEGNQKGNAAYWNLKLANGAAFVAEGRDSAMGVNLQGTNYIVIGKRASVTNSSKKRVTHYTSYFRAMKDIQNKDYTLSAWYKPFSTPKDDQETERQHAILSKPGFHIGLTYGSNKKFAMSHQWKNEAGDSVLSAAISSRYSPNKWYHVVGTVNREEGIVGLYINGKLVDTASFDPNAVSNGQFEWNSWYVGAANPLGEYAWFADGAVDEVRIYAKALEEEIVQKLYAYEKPDPYGDGLKVFYEFAGDLENSIKNTGHQGQFQLDAKNEPTNNPVATKDRFGKPNSAFRFDGNQTQRFSATGTALPQTKVPRTLCTWFKPEKLEDNTQFILGWGRHSGNGFGSFALRIGTNTLNGHFSHGNLEKNDLFVGKLSEGTWHHAAMSYDENNIVRLYLDGEEIAKSTNTLATSGTTLRVGGIPFITTNAFFSGVIDDVRVYNKALPPEVIDTIYSAGKPASTWYWYVLGTILLLGGVGYFLYWRGLRIPAKMMDPLLQRLPDKLSSALVRFRQEEEVADAAGAAAPT